MKLTRRFLGGSNFLVYARHGRELTVSTGSGFQAVKFLLQSRLSETSFGEPTPALPECDPSNDARMN